MDSYSKLHAIDCINRSLDVCNSVDVQSDVLEQHPLYAIGYAKGCLKELLSIINAQETEQ